MSRSSFSLRQSASRLALAALLSAPIVLLSACGGGGGDGGGSGSVTPPPVGASPVAITTANQNLVAADALDNSTDVEAARSSTTLLTGVQVEGGGTGGSLLVADTARVLLGKVRLAPAIATGVQVGPQTEACAFGGSMTVSGNLSGGSLVVAGDSLTIIASNCMETVDGVTATMNGTLVIGIVNGSFNPTTVTYPLHLVMSITVSGLSVTIAGRTETSSGDMLIDLTERSPTESSGVVSGTSLSNTVAITSGKRTVTLKNYRQQIAMNNGAGIFDVSATVETTNGRLGGGTLSYGVSTLAPMMTNSVGDHTSGSMKVVGASNASLVLTVTVTNTFELKLDVNGDGVYDGTSTVTRDDLEALL